VRKLRYLYTSLMMWLSLFIALIYRPCSPTGENVCLSQIGLGRRLIIQKDPIGGGCGDIDTQITSSTLCGRPANFVRTSAKPRGFPAMVERDPGK
jgi:hypothetical protein